MNLKPAFLARHMITLNVTQMGQLVYLMHYLEHTRQMLPLDMTDCRRIAQATTRDHHRDLDRLLAAHFTITEHGRMPDTETLRLSRQDLLLPADRRHDRVTPAAIPRHAPSVTTDETQRDAHKTRQKRYREQIETMKAQARTQGHSPRKHASKQELDAMLGVTLRRDEESTEASRPHHSRAEFIDRDREIPSQSIPGNGVTPADTAVAALRRLGIEECSAGHPVLLQLLKAGITVAELEDAGRVAMVKAHNGGQFAYALKVAETRRRQAAEIGELPDKQDFRDKWGVRKP